MTIPNSTLEITVDFEKFNLGDFVIFDPPSDAAENIQYIISLRRFLIANTNWTRAEVDKIEALELGQVALMIAEAIQKKTIPLSS